jgi:hypothetical protein
MLDDISLHWLTDTATSSAALPAEYADNFNAVDMLDQSVFVVSSLVSVVCEGAIAAA